MHVLENKMYGYRTAILFTLDGWMIIRWILMGMNESFRIMKEPRMFNIDSCSPS